MFRARGISLDNPTSKQLSVLEVSLLKDDVIISTKQDACIPTENSAILYCDMVHRLIGVHSSNRCSSMYCDGCLYEASRRSVGNR